MKHILNSALSVLAGSACMGMLSLSVACSEAKARPLSQTSPEAAVGEVSLSDRVEALLELNRGQALDSRRDEGERLAHYERGLKLAPANQPLRFKAAWTCWLAGDFEEAARHYAQLEGAGRSNGLLWLGHSLFAAGDIDGARSAYEARAESTSPVYWAPAAMPGEDSPGQARLVLHWSREVKQHPESAMHRWMHGNALVGANRHAEAAAAYERALELDPTLHLARASLAMALSRGGDPKAADRVIAGLPDKFSRTALGSYVGLMVADELGDCETVVERCLVHLEAADREVKTGVLVRGAQAALACGKQAEGIRFLNEAFLVRETNRRAIMGDSDKACLEEMVRARPQAALEHYAYASSLFGYMKQVTDETTRTANLLSFGSVVESLGRINTPSREDIARYGDLTQEIEAATQNLDLGRAMAGQLLAQFQPHYGRAIREARAAIAADPSFLAAKVLLSEILDHMGDQDEADAILAEILEARPDATSIRLRMSYRVPLERAFELVESVDPRDTSAADVLMRRAFLQQEAGEQQLAAERALDFIEMHREAWDVQELVAFQLDGSGEDVRALELLDASAPSGRSARGALLRAELRDRLGRDGVVVALIDAWRSSPSGSAEERRAVRLLGRQDTRSHSCGRCNGGGTISVTQGQTGEYGSIRTTQQACPKCLGLGLWGPGVL